MLHRKHSQEIMFPTKWRIGESSKSTQMNGYFLKKGKKMHTVVQAKQAHYLKVCSESSASAFP